jgi:type II secretory pathway component PulL
MWLRTFEDSKESTCFETFFPEDYKYFNYSENNKIINIISKSKCELKYIQIGITKLLNESLKLQDLRQLYFNPRRDSIIFIHWLRLEPEEERSQK